MELLSRVELGNGASSTSSDVEDGSRHTSDARTLVRNIVRVQTALHIEPSLSLRDTLAKAEELLKLPKTIQRPGECTEFKGTEGFAKSAERILKLLELWGCRLD